MIKLNGIIKDISNENKEIFDSLYCNDIEIDIVDNNITIKFKPYQRFRAETYNCTNTICCNEIVTDYLGIQISNDHIQYGAKRGCGEILIEFSLDKDFYKDDYMSYNEDEDDYCDDIISDYELIKISLSLISDTIGQLEDAEEGLDTFYSMCDEGWLDD